MKWQWFVSSLLVLALVGVASAEEVLLNDGTAVEAEIQSIDETGMTVTYEGKTLTVKPSDVDAHYYYTLWAKRAEKTADSHLKLALFAYENGLFSQAKTQYDKAKRLDAEAVKVFEDEVIPKLKEGVAAQLLALTRQAIAKEDWDQAKRLASKILTQLEDTQAAAEAREKLASVHLWQMSKDQERLVRSLARYLPKDEEQALKTQERISQKLDPIQRRMTQAEDLSTKALRTNSTNRQKGVFQQAGQRFDKIVKDLDKLAAEAAGDDALLAHIEELRKTAVRDGIDAYVAAGQVYLVRRSYEEAMKMANAALLLDPDSAAAKHFQQQTLRGSQMRGGWGR